MWNAKAIFLASIAVFSMNCFVVNAQDFRLGKDIYPTPGPLPYPIPSSTKESYYVVKPDLRKCVFPICGGWFVKQVNRNLTQCLDGSRQPWCYVATERLMIPKLSNEQKYQLRQAMSESNALLQGRLLNNDQYGTLVVSSAWVSATDEVPHGVFVNLGHNGINCITAPCPSFDGEILNKNKVKSLAGYDLDEVAATSEQRMLAEEAVFSDEGLPIAGHFFEITGPSGSAQGIVADQFYLKVAGEKLSYCRATGCSGQICGDEGMVSTCEWRPEYACYKTATCSVQGDGECGWIMDDQLRSCLAKSKLNQSLGIR